MSGKWSSIESLDHFCHLIPIHPEESSVIDLGDLKHRVHPWISSDSCSAWTNSQSMAFTLRTVGGLVPFRGLAAEERW